MDLTPRSGKSPGEENGNTLQYSYLGNPMDRGAWGGYSPWGRKRVIETKRPRDFEIKTVKDWESLRDPKEFLNPGTRVLTTV